MRIVGINWSTNSSGEHCYTLHVVEPFNAYHTDAETGRGCIGERVDSIYCGTYACNHLKVNDVIEVYYDRAVSTAKGTYQSVKHIEVLSQTTKKD